MKNLFYITLFIILNSTAVAENKAQGGTGFKINDIRIFESTENTVFKEDGEVITETKAQGGTGFKTRYKVSATNPQLTTGELEEIDLINIYKGPVLSVSPFQIFNIQGLVNSQTYYVDNAATNNLQAGDSVLLSGYIDNESMPIISRVEVVKGLTEWKISGHVENLSSNQFNINNQTINYVISDVASCTSGFAEGVFVEVLAQPVIGFQPNDAIDTVSQINCVDRSVNPGNPQSDVIIEGMIDAVSLNGDFVIAGQNVVVTQSTLYIRGRSDDIQPRIKVEVAGTVDDISGELTAAQVLFLEARFNMKLPVNPADLNASTFNVAGVDLRLTPQTLDPDGVLTAGLNEPKQLQLKGYGFADSELFITQIFERGQVDYNEVFVEGEVTSIARPFVEIFGVTIDSSYSIFFDTEGVQITADDFFALITTESIINIDQATLDMSSGVISSGVLSIDDLADIDLQRSNKNSLATPTLFGVGRITSLPDIIFKNTFE